MELCFIYKRIKEQEEYIDKIKSSKLPYRRQKELVSSALSQKLYFTLKLKQITNMRSSVEKVKEFHETFEHPIGENSQHVEPLKTRQLRIKLLFEELQELAEAGDVLRTFYDLCLESQNDILATNYDFYEDHRTLDLRDGDNVNKLEELDAITDLQYVLDGKKLTSGLHTITDQAFDLIHQNNMQKAHRSAQHVAETAFKNKISLELKYRDSLILAFNEDGKLTKPWDHKKVNLSHLIK